MKEQRPSTPSFLNHCSKDGPNARSTLSTSRSWHNFHGDDEDLRGSGPKVVLNDEEKSFLPKYGSSIPDSYPIQEDFLASEAIPEWGLKGVHYLGSAERALYEIRFEDGVYKNSRGMPLCGELLYIMLPNNKLYGCNPGTQRHHSYLSSGLNVKAAGMLFFYYGILTTVSNESGHYKLKNSEMHAALKYFHEKTIAPLIFEDHSAIDTDKPDHGVKHFQVEVYNHDLHLRELPLPELESLINQSAEYSAELLKSRPPLETADSSSDSDDYASPSAYFSEPKDFADVYKKDPAFYLKQTCLGRMRHQQHRSRFMGNARIKNQ